MKSGLLVVGILAVYHIILADGDQLSDIKYCHSKLNKKSLEQTVIESVSQVILRRVVESCIEGDVTSKVMKMWSKNITDPLLQGMCIDDLLRSLITLAENQEPSIKRRTAPKPKGETVSYQCVDRQEGEMCYKYVYEEGIPISLEIK